MMKYIDTIRKNAVPGVMSSCNANVLRMDFARYMMQRIQPATVSAMTAGKRKPSSPLMYKVKTSKEIAISGMKAGTILVFA